MPHQKIGKYVRSLIFKIDKETSAVNNKVLANVVGLPNSRLHNYLIMIIAMELRM